MDLKNADGYLPGIDVPTAVDVVALGNAVKDGAGDRGVAAAVANADVGVVGAVTGNCCGNVLDPKLASAFVEHGDLKRTQNCYLLSPHHS
jgi:hypothetical protein